MLNFDFNSNQNNQNPELVEQDLFDTPNKSFSSAFQVTPIQQHKVSLNVSLPRHTKKTSAKSSYEMAKGDGPQIIESIIRQATDTTSSERKILDELSHIDTNLQLELPVTAQSVRSAQIAKTVFVTSLVFFTVLLGYKFLQHNNFYGLANLNYTSSSQKKVNQLELKEVTNHYMEVAVNIDQLAKLTPVYQSSLFENNKSNLTKSRSQVKKTLINIQSKLSEATTLLEQNSNIALSLNSSIQQKIYEYKDLLNSNLSDPNIVNHYNQASNLYSAALHIATISEFKHGLDNINIQNLSDQDTLDILKKLFQIAPSNSQTQIVQAQLSSIHWAQVFKTLDNTITKFDPRFKVFSYTSRSNLKLTSYNYTATNNLFTVSGTLKTPTSATLTAIANLVEVLEKSDHFTEINYTTSNKEYNPQNETYSTNLKLSFKLKNNYIQS